MKRNEATAAENAGMNVLHNSQGPSAYNQDSGDEEDSRLVLKYQDLRKEMGMTQNSPAQKVVLNAEANHDGMMFDGAREQFETLEKIARERRELEDQLALLQTQSWGDDVERDQQLLARNQRLLGDDYVFAEADEEDTDDDDGFGEDVGLSSNSQRAGVPLTEGEKRINMVREYLATGQSAIPIGQLVDLLTDDDIAELHDDELDRLIDLESMSDAPHVEPSSTRNVGSRSDGGAGKGESYLNLPVVRDSTSISSFNELDQRAELAINQLKKENKRISKKTHRDQFGKVHYSHHHIRKPGARKQAGNNRKSEGSPVFINTGRKKSMSPIRMLNGSGQVSRPLSVGGNQSQKLTYQSSTSSLPSAHPRNSPDHGGVQIAHNSHKPARTIATMDVDELSNNNKDIGVKIQVYKYRYDHWYEGTIVGFDRQRKMHCVQYDDGDKQWHDLSQKDFKILELSISHPSRERKISSHSRGRRKQKKNSRSRSSKKFTAMEGLYK